MLNEVPAIGTPDETGFLNVQLADVQFQLNGLPLSGPEAPDVGGQLAELQTAEATILSYDGGALDSYVSPWFSNVDTSWLQGSEALLAADQAFETAAADGSSPIPAELAIFAADLNLLGSAANSVSLDWASSLLGSSAGGLRKRRQPPPRWPPPTSTTPPHSSTAPTRRMCSRPSDKRHKRMGAETVISTDASGDVIGTQDFTVSEFGFPVDIYWRRRIQPRRPIQSPGLAVRQPLHQDISFAGAPEIYCPITPASSLRSSAGMGQRAGGSQHYWVLPGNWRLPGETVRATKTSPPSSNT